MRKLFALFCVVVLLTGCGSKNETAQAPTMTASEGSTQLVAPPSPSQPIIQEGLNEISSGKINEGFTTLFKAIKTNPRDTEAYLVLGEAYMRFKQYDQAIEAFKSASQVDPQSGRAYYLSAVAYFMSGNKEESVKNAQHSIQVFKDQQDSENFKRAVSLLRTVMNSEAGQEMREIQSL